MSETKRYYWLKLPENFFDATDDETISFIEEQEGGSAYVLFYLKLLCKALRTDGTLIRLIGNRYVPYDEKSLSKLTNTPVDTVRCAVSILKEVGLLKQLDSGELYLTQINEFVGSETNKAVAMRKTRAKNRLEGNNVTPALPDCYPDVTQSKRKSKEKEEREEELEKEKKKRKSSPTVTDEIASELMEPMNISDPVKEKVHMWLQYKSEIGDTYKMTGFKTLLKQVEKVEQERGSSAVINQIDKAMRSSWHGMYLENIGTDTKYGNNNKQQRVDPLLQAITEMREDGEL